MSNARKPPPESSYECPYFTPEDLHATLDYLAGVLPAHADPVHRQRLDYLRRLVEEQSFMLRAAGGREPTEA